MSWIPLDRKYFVRSLVRDNTFSVLLTDFQTLFATVLSFPALKDRNHEFNPDLEFEKSEDLVNLLQDKIKAVTEVSMEDICEKSIHLKINSNIGDIPFRFEFTLLRQSPDSIIEGVSLPLVFEIQHLLKQREELMKLLEKKDREIDDYKTMAGARVSKPFLETPVFNREVFLENQSDSKVLLETYRVLGTVPIPVEDLEGIKIAASTSELVPLRREQSGSTPVSVLSGLTSSDGCDSAFAYSSTLKSKSSRFKKKAKLI